MRKKVRIGYSAPRLISSQVRNTSAGVCGWHTQCGKYVRSYD